jgi:hypothetical protein
MRVIKAIAKCIQRLVDTENEVRVLGTETQNLESVSVRCYAVLETVYRYRLHYTYSWAYTYTKLYPYNYNILYYHYYDMCLAVKTSGVYFEQIK